MKLPPGLTLEQVIEAETSDNGRGFCIKCGAERDGWTEPDVFGQKHALSRKTLDEPKDGKSPRTRWKEILRDMNQDCLDRQWGGLPSVDNTDIGD